jgi:hypothetical protein
VIGGTAPSRVWIEQCTYARRMFDGIISTAGTAGAPTILTFSWSFGLSRRGRAPPRQDRSGAPRPLSPPNSLLRLGKRSNIGSLMIILNHRVSAVADRRPTDIVRAQHDHQ